MGVTPITRASGKQVYQLAFSYMGVQCREVLPGPHSTSRLNYCKTLRDEIVRRVEAGAFTYTEYFPNSARAAIFGHGHGKAKTLKDALEDYRDRTKKTLEVSTWNPYRRDIENILIRRWGHIRRRCTRWLSQPRCSLIWCPSSRPTAWEKKYAFVKRRNCSEAVF